MWLWNYTKMAGSAHSAAPLCYDKTVLFCDLCCLSAYTCSSLFCLSIQSQIYSLEFLIDIGENILIDINPVDVKVIQEYGLTWRPSRPPTPTLVSHLQWITLVNVRSLDNKMDYIRLLRSTTRTVGDCCVLVFVETLLNNNVPDCAIHLDQLTCYCADRVLD